MTATVSWPIANIACNSLIQTENPFAECLTESHCPEGLCAAHRVGDNCAECGNGYFDIVGHRCFPCSYQKWAMLGAAMILMSFLLFIGAEYDIAFEPETIVALRLLVSGMQRLKMSLNFIQIEWPHYFIWFFSCFDWLVVGFDFIGPSCFVDNYDVYHALSVPFAMICFVVFVFGILPEILFKLRLCFSKTIEDKVARKIRVDKQRTKIRCLLVSIVLVSYIPFHEKMASPQRCRSFDNRSVFALFPKDVCDEVVRIACVIAIISLGICVPLFIVFQGRTEKSRSTFSTLYSVYTDSVPWFESIVLLQKFFLFIAQEFLRGSTLYVSVAIPFIVNSIYLCIAVRCKPYVKTVCIVRVKVIGLHKDVFNALHGIDIINGIIVLAAVVCQLIVIVHPSLTHGVSLFIIG